MGNNPCYSKQERGESTTRFFGFGMGQCHGIDIGCAGFGSGQAAMVADPEKGGPGPSDLTQTRDGSTYPGFCGGAGDDTMHSSQEDSMEANFGSAAGLQGPMSSLDYVAQNLQRRLGNPRNRCHANSAFRLWAWAGSFMGGEKLWQLTTPAAQGALNSDDTVHLPALPGLESLSNKFDDNTQDDASYFLQEMVELAQAEQVIKSYHSVDFAQQVHHRQAFPVHLIFPEKEGPAELEHLISEWANYQEGQVFDGQGLWVAQVGRYAKVHGEWTKHHRALNVPSIFNLPITLDGDATCTKQFSVIGYLCHAGSSNNSGHYYAVFLYRGLSWIVDDGAYPRVMPQVLKQTQQQIVQVWALPSECLLPTDIPCDVNMEPEHPIGEAPAKRQRQECVKFDFANVTQLGQGVRQWLLTRPRQPICIVETHLGKQDHEKTMQWLTTRALSALGEPAAESTKGGTNGGMMIIFPHNLHFHFVQKQIIEGCGWYAVVWSFENCEIILVFSYFKCGEGVQGPTNSQLWAGLISFVTSVRKPVIVAGDFNLDPGAFMTTTMAQVMQVQVLATGEATCNTGSEIDWALISTSLAADVAVQSNWIVPFKPHAMLQFKIAGHFQDLTVRQLSKFGPAPQLKNPSYEWHQTDEQDTQVQWLNRQTDPLTQTYAAA